MKERKISIAVTVHVIFVSGKKTSIYRVWKRIWMPAELLKNGSVHVKDLYSRKKDLYFEADLHMEADENGRVTFSLSFPKKKTTKKNRRK